jgi:hypothetical protein
MSAAIGALTKSLARPVVLGMLPRPHAYGAIALVVARDHTIADLAGAMAAWDHVLDLNIKNLETLRCLVEAAIKRALRHLIRRRAPWGQLMAQAHDINGDAGFPLTEGEVAAAVKSEVYFSLPVARRGGHGR